MRISTLALLFLVTLTQACTEATPQEKFWSWFLANEEMLFDIASGSDENHDELYRQIQKVHPDLVYEFGPTEDDEIREFVISAGGIQEAFSAVESLFKSAPVVDRWVWTKFRPRRDPINNISYGGLRINAEDVYYALYRDGNKPGIVLFLDGYADAERGTYGTIGYLFLDEALGEYDVETKVGFVEFQSQESDQFQSSYELSGLAAHFDTVIEDMSQ